MNVVDAEITQIIDQILDSNKKYDTESSHLNVKQLNLVFDHVKDILKEEPTLLKLSAPITLVGDVHGQLYDLRRIFKQCGDPSKRKYLFLGDYVDRGFLSLDTITLLFCYKILYPQNIFLLRGNHEFPNVNKFCGFYNSIMKEYNNKSIFDKANEIFEYISLAALINEKVFCSHAGISSKLDSFEQINEIEKPLNLYHVFDNDEKIVIDIIAGILFADTDPKIEYWKKGMHAFEVFFGCKAVDEFIEKFNLKMVCRGHEVNNEGICYNFPENKSFITVFSAPKFKTFYDNKGAVMHLNENLEYTATIFDPILPKMDPKTAHAFELMRKRKNLC